MVHYHAAAGQDGGSTVMMTTFDEDEARHFVVAAVQDALVDDQAVASVAGIEILPEPYELFAHLVETRQHPAIVELVTPTGGMFYLETIRSEDTCVHGRRTCLGTPRIPIGVTRDDSEWKVIT